MLQLVVEMEKVAGEDFSICEIKVSDCGTGMSEALFKSKICDADITTKPESDPFFVIKN